MADPPAIFRCFLSFPIAVFFSSIIASLVAVLRVRLTAALSNVVIRLSLITTLDSAAVNLTL